MQLPRKIQTLAILGTGATIAFERMAATDWRFLQSQTGVLICLWSVLPYVLMIAGDVVIKAPRAQAWWLSVSIILFVMAMAAYIDTLFVHPDAQGALMFLFLPLVQGLIGAGALILIRVLAGRA